MKVKSVPQSRLSTNYFSYHAINAVIYIIFRAHIYIVVIKKFLLPAASQAHFAKENYERLKQQTRSWRI